MTWWSNHNLLFLFRISDSAGTTTRYSPWARTAKTTSQIKKTSPHSRKQKQSPELPSSRILKLQVAIVSSPPTANSFSSHTCNQHKTITIWLVSCFPESHQCWVGCQWYWDGMWILHDGFGLSSCNDNNHVTTQIEHKLSKQLCTK